MGISLGALVHLLERIGLTFGNSIPVFLWILQTFARRDTSPSLFADEVEIIRCQTLDRLLYDIVLNR